MAEIFVESLDPSYDEDDHDLRFAETLAPIPLARIRPFSIDALDSDSESHFNSCCDSNSESNSNTSCGEDGEICLGQLGTGEDLIFRVSELSGAMGSNEMPAPGLGFGIGGAVFACESSTGRTVEPRDGGVINDSDSDEEDGVRADLNCGNHSCDDYDNGMDEVDDLDYGLCWDSFRLDDRGIGTEDFEWEEVIERVDDGRGALSMMFDGFDDLVTPEMENSGDSINEFIPNLDWEVLFAANNLESILDIDPDGEGGSYLSVGDDHMNGQEYNETFLGLLADEEYALRGSPPAAKLAVDNLQMVVLTQEDLGKSDSVVCAICKDELLLEEKVRRLPCSHNYHGNCIVPWLAIRNTCPVCRYELPTDDPEYERRKSRRPVRGLS